MNNWVHFREAAEGDVCISFTCWHNAKHAWEKKSQKKKKEIFFFFPVEVVVCSLEYSWTQDERWLEGVGGGRWQGDTSKLGQENSLQGDLLLVYFVLFPLNEGWYTKKTPCEVRRNEGANWILSFSVMQVPEKENQLYLELQVRFKYHFNLERKLFMLNVTCKRI